MDWALNMDWHQDGLAAPWSGFAVPPKLWVSFSVSALKPWMLRVGLLDTQRTSGEDLEVKNMRTPAWPPDRVFMYIFGSVPKAILVKFQS